MQEFNLELLNQLLGKDVEKEFNLDHFPPEEKNKILAKLEERIQNVILETALAKMTEGQFNEFKKAVSDESNPEAMQNKVAELAKGIDGLGEILKNELTKELEELKKIVNEK
ncbi:MAG: hypothetical protein V1898_00180 [Patescibacteria group bacterium]